MGHDVREFVAASRVCSQQKTLSRPPAGLMHPLSVPRPPWSHTALDFVSGLPVSRGNTVIMTVVDHFSKGCHFVPLPGLPTAWETAKLVIHHVFQLHGLPRDVVSDCCPQFTSLFWREFCRCIVATVSLSSGYHPQSNGLTERANQELEKLLRCLCSAVVTDLGLDGSLPVPGGSGIPASSVRGAGEEAAASPSIRAFL